MARYVTDRALAAHIDISVTTVYRWVKAGRIPPPLKFGPNTSRWDLNAVDAALAKAAEEAVGSTRSGLAAAHAAYAALDPEVRKAHAVRGGSTKRRRTALREQATAVKGGE